MSDKKLEGKHQKKIISHNQKIINEKKCKDNQFFHRTSYVKFVIDLLGSNFKGDIKMGLSNGAG